MKPLDVIVIGTGGVGSAAVYHLARQGHQVLGLDRFPAGHDRGSSHGATRIIRKAYFEHPDYVPLLHRSYDLWRSLEEETGSRMYEETGLVEIGPPEGVVIPGVLRSAAEHDLDVSSLTPSDLAERFPSLHLPEGSRAVWEREAGFLRVEDCVRAHLRQAGEHGATLLLDEPVLAWNAGKNAVSVSTKTNTYEAAALILTAGAWAPSLLGFLGMPLTVLRKHLHWYPSPSSMSLETGFPCFFYETGEGYFYGFPSVDEFGIKVAEHSGGTKVDDPLTDPTAPESQDQERVESFLKTHLPEVGRPSTRHARCFYTMSPDEHFIVDVHPEHENVAFAAGLSGHGFKFTPVLGQALAHLATGNATGPEFEFLKRR